MTSTTHRWVFLLAVLALALGASSAQAQTGLFPGKFVCGYQQGNVPLLSDPNPLPPEGASDDEIKNSYEDFKPGNYATKVNILGLEMDTALDDVTVVISVPDVGVFFMDPTEVGLGQTLMIGCLDIVDRLLTAAGTSNPPPPPNLVVDGSLIEGFVLVVTPTPNFVVEGIYTYESQNAYERHQVYRDTGQANLVQQFGTLNQTLGTIFGIPLNVFTGPLGTVPPLAPVSAASGAGGLGLGASIDVERFEPVTIVTPTAPGTSGGLSDKMLDRLFGALR